MDWLMGKGRRNKEKEVTTPTHQVQGQGQEESKPYLDDDYVQERFLDVDFTQLVLIPRGIDNCEWLATHVKSFFEHINLMYGCLSEYCQPTTCPVMSGPSAIQYQWLDEKGKKCKCTAPQYIEYVMTYCQKCIYDESIFPTKYGNVFPSTFVSTVKKICRLLLHVISHMYHAHSSRIALLKFHGHLNTIFYHFHLFSRQFSLVDDKELEVLDDLYKRLHHYATRKVQFDSSADQSDAVIDSETSSVGIQGDSGVSLKDNSVRLLSEGERDRSSIASCETSYAGVALAT